MLRDLAGLFPGKVENNCSTDAGFVKVCGWKMLYLARQVPLLGVVKKSQAYSARGLPFLLMPSKSKNIRILNAAGAQLFSVAEVAQRWRCPYNAAHRRLRKSGVPVIALGPRALRVRLSEIHKAE